MKSMSEIVFAGKFCTDRIKFLICGRVKIENIYGIPKNYCVFLTLKTHKNCIQK